MKELIFGITVSNEIEEIKRLLDLLTNNKLKKKIVVQYDSTKSSDELISILKNYDIHYYGYEFKNDFADFKNKLNDTCESLGADYIFQLDADEMITDFLIAIVNTAIMINKDVELIYIPRINTVDGLTNEYVTKWRWNINEKGYINFPDYQGRIYRSDLRFYGKVHEQIKGHQKYSTLPLSDEYCLQHHKKIERQIKQNDLYSKL